MESRLVVRKSTTTPPKKVLASKKARGVLVNDKRTLTHKRNHLVVPKQFKLPKPRALKFKSLSSGEFMNSLASMVNAFSGTTDCTLDSVSARFSALNPILIKSLKKEMSSFLGSMTGTQEPTFRMRSNISFQSSTLGNIGVTYGMTFGTLMFFTSFQTIFDEYQYRRNGKFFVRPCYINSNDAASSGSFLPLCVGVIDYVSTASPPIVNQLLAYDTRKFFCPTAFQPRISDDSCPTWDLVLKGIPDMTWYDTALSGQIVANFFAGCLNVYTSGFSSTITNLFSTDWECEIRFRQIGV